MWERKSLSVVLLSWKGVAVRVITRPMIVMTFEAHMTGGTTVQRVVAKRWHKVPTSSEVMHWHCRTGPLPIHCASARKCNDDSCDLVLHFLKVRFSTLTGSTVAHQTKCRKPELPECNKPKTNTLSLWDSSGDKLNQIPQLRNSYNREPYSRILLHSP